MIDRVTTHRAIVPLDAAGQVVRDSSVEASSVKLTLENVDDPLFDAVHVAVWSTKQAIKIYE